MMIVDNRGEQKMSEARLTNCKAIGAMSEDELKQLRKDLVEMIKNIDKKIKHGGKGKYILEMKNPESNEDDIYYCDKLEEMSKLTGKSVATIYRVLNAPEKEPEKEKKKKINFTVRLNKTA